MKKRNIIAIVLAMTVGLAHAATIEYNFDDGNGAVVSNTFGFGVSAETFILTSGGGTVFSPVVHPSAGTDPKARIGARKSSQGGAYMSFAVTIPADVTVDVTGLTWENGADWNGVTWPPLWDLSITSGSATPSSGAVVKALRAGII